ncbi:DUF998 domain-containing protein [Streptomyces sp. NPDC090025]|uniref:DUF998 domain-containing protein n=1 Tax=Streptomyces sp. NPDC090025 TaxID=3365922 RepID=UPI003838DE73
MKARIGYAAWVLGVVQFFVVQVVVGSAWAATPYSWMDNNISDLGNALCATQSEPEPRYICSPRHDLMNFSFVALGVLLVVGVVLTGRALWRRGAGAGIARGLLAAAGVGFALAGLAPADVDENQHVLGALLIMALGNIGLVAAGFALTDTVPAALRRAAGVLGVVAFAALALFLSRTYLGLGMGGMERVAAFPLLLWAGAVGAYGLRGAATARAEAYGRVRP